jgi:cytochrome c peroxidase
MRGKFVILSVAACAAVMALVVTLPAQQTLTPTQELGKSIFFDKNLSVNNNQSCATCHGKEAGWTGPDSVINLDGAVYEGSIPGAFGDRKPPSVAYATQSPILHFDDEDQVWQGGNFWDGRATGERLGSPAAEQAQGPFLNPMEQALPSVASVVDLVCTASYSNLFMDVCGAVACSGTPAAVSAAYDCIGYSVAAYEASPEVNAFSSKFDASGRNADKLKADEKRGFELFIGKAKCSQCHPAEGTKPLFTDYTYDNLGIPKNPSNPVYQSNPGFVDTGLGAFLKSRGSSELEWVASYGKHKVPTTRNVAKGLPSITKAFGHNGYFKSLEGIVHFYNTRDVKPPCSGDYTEAEALAANCWPLPEVPANVNRTELGDLGLTPKDEAAIVAFLKTLSDGYLTLPVT